MMRRWLRKLIGVDRWWHWRIMMKSKLLSMRCILLGGHTHEWKKAHGGGSGYDVLICTRCVCHIAKLRNSKS